MLFNRKLKRIKNLIIKNGGATLDARTLKPATYKRGYMVSLDGSELKLNINDLKVKTIKQYQKQAKQARACVGFWIDEGVLYLDISKHYTSKNSAVRSALKNNQIALFDIYNNTSVYLKDIKTKRATTVKYTF